LQVKLCDPCLSAYEALCVKMRYTNRRILYFTVYIAAKTPNAFPWVGQPLKIAPSCGRISTPI